MSESTATAVSVVVVFLSLFAALAFWSQTAGCQMGQCERACRGAVHSFRVEKGAPVCECIR